MSEIRQLFEGIKLKKCFVLYLVNINVSLKMASINKDETELDNNYNSAKDT